jgi:hypothetical protein
LLGIKEQVTDVKQVYVDQERLVVGLVLKGDDFPEVEEGELIPLATIQVESQKHKFRFDL